MECNIDAKSSKNKVNKMGGSKKKTTKKPFFSRDLNKNVRQFSVSNQELL